MAHLVLGRGAIDKELPIDFLVKLLTLVLLSAVEFELLVECLEIGVRHRLAIAVVDVERLHELSELFLLIHHTHPLCMLRAAASLIRLWVICEVKVCWEVSQ
jgi:hypothetical protein